MSWSKCAGTFGRTAISGDGATVCTSPKGWRAGLIPVSCKVAIRLVTLSLCTALVSCGGQAIANHDTIRASRPLLPWTFASTDGVPFAANDVLGRTTIVLFLATYDAASQNAANRLETCLHSLARRTNAIAVAMEPPDHAVLVSTFHDALRLSYPVLMPDPGTLAGQGPFGTIEVVPTWVVLDAFGREIWRGVGVRSLPQMKEVLVRMGNAAEQRTQGCS
jgi:hypothetical protein